MSSISFFTLCITIYIKTSKFFSLYLYILFQIRLVIKAPINEPPLPRRKKCPELAYRHHEFIDHDADRTDSSNITRARVSFYVFFLIHLFRAMQGMCVFLYDIFVLLFVGILYGVTFFRFMCYRSCYLFSCRMCVLRWLNAKAKVRTVRKIFCNIKYEKFWDFTKSERIHQILQL